MPILPSALGDYTLLQPERWWAGMVETTQKRNDVARAIELIGSRARVRISGYLEESQHTSIYHLTRTRGRADDQMVEPSVLHGILEGIQQELGGEIRIEERSAIPRLRVLLGLAEGYILEGQQYRIHGIDDIAPALSSGVSHMPVHIIAKRPGQHIYQEPAALLTSTPDQVPLIVDLAQLMGQVRFTVEDLLDGMTYTYERNVR